MGVIAAVADLLIERTQAGLIRVKAEGKALGRPSALTPVQLGQVRTRLAGGEAVAALAREFGTSGQTIMRARAAAA